MTLTSRLLSCATLLLLVWAFASVFATDAAAQQCRFIRAKAEREACYTKQEQGLAAKRAKKTDMTDELQRMKRDNDELTNRLKSICRGC